MKLILENWREYLKENVSETTEGKILNDIYAGKTLEEIKARYKFSSPAKERIVEGAYEYLTSAGLPAVWKSVELAWGNLFTNRSHADDKRGVSLFGIGWAHSHGGGLFFATRKDIAAVENLEDKSNRQRVFGIIKSAHPEFMKFLSFVRLLVGSQKKKMKIKELVKEAETGRGFASTPLKDITSSIGIDIV